jgi:hypothetical protein
MKIRITPLNFASAFFLFAAIYSWIFGVSVSGVHLHVITASIGWIFLLFAIVVSFMDIMLRNFFPDIKKLWLIELSFLTLVLVLFFLVK